MRLGTSAHLGLLVLAMALGCSTDDAASPADAGVDATDADVDATDADVDAADAGVVPAIVHPPDGTALRARRQRFEWTGSGTNYRLRVGTTPGTAGIFASAPLGNATSVTVDGLPLNGATIYVELLSGPEDATVRSTNTYQAPVRRGLAVVVDFADLQLEDWQGPGMSSLGDVTAQLEAMVAHWEWLSRGVEKAQWDVVRVQVDQQLSATAFADLNVFRDEVVALTKQQVSVADYDVDSDGILDGIWAIVADQGSFPTYAGGGTSRNQGANIFVDGQATDSVVGGHTGNFNHEFGHTMELPDLYGPYETLVDLTVMSNSWALPPNDFTALERILLGWVDPVVVGHTMTGVVVPDANEHLFALEIPTGRPEEYFLIEYRTRPESGFGSCAATDFDGLAVYHVLEVSDQHTDPPLLKLEPADGVIVPGVAPGLHAFVYPENPNLVRPLVLRTYFGNDPVFQIDDVQWTANGSIAVDLSVLPMGPGSAPNRVINPSVEAGLDGWSHGGWKPDEATFTWASIGANGSARSLSIASTMENDVEWRSQVTGLEPGRAYYLCGLLKGADVVGGVGASISISGASIYTQGLHGTFDWTPACRTVIAAGTTTDVACRLGGFGATSSGQMWCDDVSLVALDSAF